MKLEKCWRLFSVLSIRGFPTLLSIQWRISEVTLNCPLGNVLGIPLNKGRFKLIYTRKTTSTSQPPEMREVKIC